MIDGVAHYSAADQCWVAVVEWDRVYHASEQALRSSANGGASKRPARKA